jgi:hypothetical protein
MKIIFILLLLLLLLFIKTKIMLNYVVFISILIYSSISSLTITSKYICTQLNPMCIFNYFIKATLILIYGNLIFFRNQIISNKLTKLNLV